MQIHKARALLEELLPSEKWKSEEMWDTPARWCKAMEELADGESKEFNFTTFANPGNDEMVVVSDIPFATLCSHHLLPFLGRCHIGYVPDRAIAGLSKLPRLVEHTAKGTWNQEGLTQTIANRMQEELAPIGVAIVMEAEHTCMSIRGVQTVGTLTTTSTMLGCFADHTRQARSEFLNLIRRSR
jgi:GTP cyclohydrolase I